MKPFALLSRRGSILMILAALALSLGACASATPAPNPETFESMPTSESTKPPVPTPTLAEGGFSTVLGEDIPIASRDHIQEGMAATDWPSDPPTSGQHYGQWAPAGFYDEAIPDGYLVHDMEHGYVIVYYNCAVTDTDCQTFKTAIESAIAAAGVDASTNTVKVIAVPRAEMENPVTYASWGHLYRPEAFVAEELVTYIQTFRSNASYAPEWNLP